MYVCMASRMTGDDTCHMYSQHRNVKQKWNRLYHIRSTYTYLLWDSSHQSPSGIPESPRLRKEKV